MSGRIILLLRLIFFVTEHSIRQTSEQELCILFQGKNVNYWLSFHSFSITFHNNLCTKLLSSLMCARLAQLVRSPTANGVVGQPSFAALLYVDKGIKLLV